jgi:ubiquinone biosynthesis protein UbiJ
MDWALIGYISGGIATIATIATFISHQLKPKFRAAGQFWAHLVGVEENVVTGQDRIPGLFEVIRDLKAQAGRMEDRLEERLDQQDGVLAKQDDVLETIRHEVEFNNGSSVKDATLRLEQGQTEHVAKLVELATRLEEHLKPTTSAPVTNVTIHTQQEHPA